MKVLISKGGTRYEVECDDVHVVYDDLYLGEEDDPDGQLDVCLNDEGIVMDVWRSKLNGQPFDGGVGHSLGTSSSTAQEYLSGLYEADQDPEAAMKICGCGSVSHGSIDIPIDAEGFDICSVCEETFPAGTLEDRWSDDDTIPSGHDDFDLICPACKQQAADDAAEEQRRDEKHGLYPQHEDPCN